MFETLPNHQKENDPDISELLSDAQKQKLGKDALRANLEELPSKEKIYRQTKEPTLKIIREEAKRQADIEIEERRAFKKRNKYIGAIPTIPKMREYEARANMPLLEEIPEEPLANNEIKIEEVEKDISNIKTGEKIRQDDNLAEKVKNIYNQYASNFKAHAPVWLAFGVSNAIERGDLNFEIKSLMRKGFWAHEESKIEENLSQKGASDYDVIDAERELRVDIYSNLIDKRAFAKKEDAEEEPTEKNPNSNIKGLDPELIQRGLYRGSLYAIASGAKVDGVSGEVIYSIPTEKTEETRNFMEETGIDFSNYEDESEPINASYQGFANIIDAIKYRPEETERGFRHLDWYFDNFGYSNRMKSFLKSMDAFQENADDAWLSKYEEYLSGRKDYLAFKEAQEKSNLPGKLDEVEGLTDEELFNEFDKFLRINEDPESQTLFPTISPGRMPTDRGLPPSTKNLPPTSREKYTKFITEYQRIKEDDPYANAYKGVFTDSVGSRKDYRIVRFGKNEHNIVIACPIANASNDAAYVWIGKTGDDREGWRAAFTEDQESGKPINKLQARQKDSIKAFYHTSAMKTRNLNAVDNMWFNILKHIEKETAA